MRVLAGLRGADSRIVHDFRAEQEGRFPHPCRTSKRKPFVGLTDRRSVQYGQSAPRLLDLHASPPLSEGACS